MANTIISVTELSNRAVDYLERQRGLVNTLWTDAVSEAVAMRKGETVNVAAPPSFTAAAYNGSTYTLQDINQSTVPVVLDKDYVVPVGITSREFGASANDIEANVIIPAMDGTFCKFEATCTRWVETTCKTYIIPGSGDLHVSRIQKRKLIF